LTTVCIALDRFQLGLGAKVMHRYCVKFSALATVG
jgi:hypothetical protein